VNRNRPPGIAPNHTGTKRRRTSCLPGVRLNGGKAGMDRGTSVSGRGGITSNWATKGDPADETSSRWAKMFPERACSAIIGVEFGSYLENVVNNMVKIRMVKISFQNWVNNHLSASNTEKFIYRYAYPWDVFGQLEIESMRIGEEYFLFEKDDLFSVKKISESSSNKFASRKEIIIDLKKLDSKQEPIQSIKNGEYKFIIGRKHFLITAFKIGEELSQRASQDFVDGDFSNLDDIVASDGWINLHLSRYLIYCALSSRQPNLGVLQKSLRAGRKSLLIDFEISKSHWVILTNTSQEAHYLGLEIAGKASLIELVYLTHTITRHHQCDISGIQIKSLIEFIFNLPNKADLLFFQAQALCNLHGAGSTGGSITGSNRLLSRIISGEIEKERMSDGHLTSAFAGLTVNPETEEELCYLAASANLINAALNRNKNLYDGRQNLTKKIYSFKSILAKKMNHYLLLNPTSTLICQCSEDKRLILVHAKGIQFSFHAIAGLINWQADIRTARWEGVRLQNCAVSAYEYARSVLIMKYKIIRITNEKA
jgi:hypothetical protein